MCVAWRNLWYWLNRWNLGLKKCTLKVKQSPPGSRGRLSPKYASHLGGICKRPIRSVRMTMLLIIGSQTLDDETKKTMLNEEERTLINHPLTPVSYRDITHLALTSNDLLTLRRSSSFMEPVNLRGIYLHE